MTSSPQPSLPALPVAGDVLAGKYQIEQVLGEGGMCVVMAARHLQLEDRVAIKLLRPEFVGNAEGIERFMREGRAAIRIRGDHVVQIHDVDVLPSGIPYLVMEHLEGNDLETMILAHGSAPAINIAVDYILQAGEAIVEAHTLGIVHRDLKPANLFLTKRADGSAWVKVLDFGISKIVPLKPGVRPERLTGGTAVMGSPQYMSPEQIRSTRDVDLRTDIWALGTILHELLCGAPAFDADGFSAICAKIMEESPASLVTLRADVPSGLAAIVLRCLKKNRDERFATMAELALALSAFASPAGRDSAQLIAGIQRSKEVPATGNILTTTGESAWTSTSSSCGPALEKTTRGRSFGAFAGALGLAAMVASGVYLHSARISSTPSLVTSTPATTASPLVDPDSYSEPIAATSAPAVGVTPPAASVNASRPAPASKIVIAPRRRAPVKASAPVAPAEPEPSTDTAVLFDDRK